MPAGNKNKSTSEKTQKQTQECVKAAFAVYEQVQASGKKPNVTKISDNHNIDHSALNWLICGGNLKDESAAEHQKILPPEEEVLV